MHFFKIFLQKPLKISFKNVWITKKHRNHSQVCHMCVKNVRVHKKLGLRRNVASRLLYPSGHYVYKIWKCVSGTFYQKKN